MSVKITEDDETGVCNVVDVRGLTLSELSYLLFHTKVNNPEVKPLKRMWKVYQKTGGYVAWCNPTWKSSLLVPIDEKDKRTKYKMEVRPNFQKGISVIFTHKDKTFLIRDYDIDFILDCLDPNWV